MKLNRDLLIKAYEGKNIFITGITGFKGSWMALVLHELGANVFGMGLKPDSRNSLFYQAKVNEIATVDFGDITEQANKSTVIKGIIKADPDYIFHMAAQPIVSKGYEDPFDTFNTNIMGTVIMHEILRGYLSPPKENENHFLTEDLKCKQISFVNITTDKVYKEVNRPLLESDELNGFDPYSLSKTCSDMISTCYRNAMGSNHPISTMRAGNVIGGGDMSENRIIPDIYRAKSDGETLKIRNPHSVRPYQHVFDAITGYLWIAFLQKNDSEFEGAYNIGPDIEQTMTTEELVKKAKENFEFEYEISNESIGKESDYLALDNTKLKGTGWKPFFNTNEKVVKSTTDWYNNFIDGEDMKEFTLKQIKEALLNV